MYRISQMKELSMQDQAVDISTFTTKETKIHNEMLKCELCKNLTLEQYIYVCESGHTICCNCDDSSHSDQRRYNDEHNDICIDMNAKNSHNNIENNSGKDLAGGDNIKIKPKAGHKKDEHYKLFGNETDADDRRSHQNQSTNSLKATLKYINSNYDGNHSSIVNFNGSKCSVKDTHGNVSVRPIICPVVNCRKTVALDSVLKHFSFDHSKIPTLTLCSGKSLKIYLKPSNLSMNVQCIAIISALNNSYPLLLMAAKFINEHWRTFEEKQNSETKSHSQDISQNLSKKGFIRDHKNEVEDDPYCDNFDGTETQSDIIIWICRLTDFTHVCSITIKREHILSYNYTGEGLHIQNKQDPKIVFDSPECLIIRRQSLSKLLDDKYQIHVYIKIFK